VAYASSILNNINIFKLVFRKWKSFPEHWENYCSARSSDFQWHSCESKKMHTYSYQNLVSLEPGNSPEGWTYWLNLLYKNVLLWCLCALVLWDACVLYWSVVFKVCIGIDSETACFPCHTQTVTTCHLQKESELQAHIWGVAQGVLLHSWHFKCVMQEVL
jgi:hypothetical protein